MKKYFLVSICLFYLSTLLMHTQPICTDCTKGTFTLASTVIALPGCPGCSITLYYWSNPDCREIFIDHFTNINEACELCGYDFIFKVAATWLLEYGPFPPPPGGIGVITRVNSFACFRAETTATNGYNLLPCNNTVCCKAVYEVKDLGGGLFEINQLSLELTPPGSLCYSPCFSVCTMNYYPRIPVNEDIKLIYDNINTNLNKGYFSSLDRLNYSFIFKSSSFNGNLINTGKLILIE